ncbi:hypothetical protein INR49_027945 [Caranx melampygus]|nr:hypothetical protein INR49_027945 [Caranx melampygus]
MLTVSDVGSESLSLQWDTPAGEVQSYIVTCCTEGETVQQLTTDTNTVTFHSLKPGVCYSLHVSTQLKNERKSEPAVTTACTQTVLERLLGDLGLEQHYTVKLSLSKILQIDEKTISDEPAKINEDVKRVLNCDFMVIIDTEGLKSPELAELDDSHEHDNELATLVVG